MIEKENTKTVSVDFETLAELLSTTADMNLNDSITNSSVVSRLISALDRNMRVELKKRAKEISEDIGGYAIHDEIDDIATY